MKTLQIMKFFTYIKEFPYMRFIFKSSWWMFHPIKAWQLVKVGISIMDAIKMDGYLEREDEITWILLPADQMSGELLVLMYRGRPFEKGFTIKKEIESLQIALNERPIWEEYLRDKIEDYKKIIKGKDNK